MLKAEKPEIAKAVADLFDVAKVLQRGDVLSWEQIEEVTGIARYTQTWKQTLNRFRRRMRQERNIEMWPQITVGLKLLTVDKQAQVPSWRRKKAWRQTHFSRRALAALERESNLPLHVRRKIAAEKQQIACDRRQLRRSQNTVNRTQVNPRANYILDGPRAKG